MKIATIVDMADALAVTHDTIALLLAPTVISAVASNIIALMSHRMRKTDPEAAERLEAARQMRMEQAAQALAEKLRHSPAVIRQVKHVGPLQTSQCRGIPGRNEQGHVQTDQSNACDKDLQGRRGDE
jgi:hypothetical protein